MMLIFTIMALIVVASAIGVVAFRNPIHSALSLVTNLLTIAGLFAQLDAHFLAAVQIIVYAGAIMVLVLFVLMLLNVKTEEPKGWALVFTSLVVVAGCIFAALIIPTLNTAFEVFPDPKGDVVGSAVNIGRVLYTEYLFPFEAASVLIMAAIVGAVMLARRRYRTSAVGGR